MAIFRIHHLAEPEFNEAQGWYAGRSALAAENFTVQFDLALVRVKARPTAHAPWRSIFRRRKISQFPYLILFHASRRFTSVLMIVHQRREPENVLATARD